MEKNFYAPELRRVVRRIDGALQKRERNNVGRIRNAAGGRPRPFQSRSKEEG